MRENLKRCAYCDKSVKSFPVEHYAMCIDCHAKNVNYMSPISTGIVFVGLSLLLTVFWYFVFFNCVFNWV